MNCRLFWLLTVKTSRGWRLITYVLHNTFYIWTVRSVLAYTRKGGNVLDRSQMTHTVLSDCDSFGSKTMSLVCLKGKGLPVQNTLLRCFSGTPSLHPSVHIGSDFEASLLYSGLGAMTHLLCRLQKKKKKIGKKLWKNIR